VMTKKLQLTCLLMSMWVGVAFAQNSQPKAVLSDVPTQASMNAWEATNKEINAIYDKICADPKYKLFFAKTPCNHPDITLQFLTDSSKADAAEKKVIVLIDAEFLKIATLQADNFRQNVNPASLGIALSNLRLQQRSESQDNLTNLYQGKISWGEYNTQRKALAASGREAVQKALRDNDPMRR
jgi:hypothetical protein